VPHASFTPPTRRRRVPLLVGSAVGAVVVAWGALYLAAGDGIARGTTVAGIDIGGRSPDAARALLDRQLRARSHAPIPVRIGDLTTTVSPTKAGLTLDTAATVEQAPTRSWNPIGLLTALVGPDEVAPVPAVDDAKLTAAMRALAKRTDTEPREGDVTFEGARVKATIPQQGRRLRQSAAATRLGSSFLYDGGALRLPARVREPKVAAAEVRRAVREFAEPAVAEPVILDVGSRQVTVNPRDLGRSLSLAPDASGRLRPVLDGARLHAIIADDLADLETPARDATFRIVDGKPRVVPAKVGEGVDPDELAGAVLPLLTTSGPERRVSVSLGVAEPALTTAQAAGLGVTERVASYTTYYPSGFAPRLTNIHRAADLMDDTLVLPGKVFSLNGTVGERTAERGFAAGYIINNGKLEVDYGGGVSQLATTTFNAAFFAGLEIVEHHPHSFYISRYPEGRESTVAWGVKDVKFRNDSGHGVFITTSYTSSSVTVRIYGTKRFRIEATKSPRYTIKPYRTIHDPRPEGTERGSCVASDGVPGFKVDVYRVFFQGGKQVDRERFHTVYNPEQQIVCGRPAPATTPTPAPGATSD
jgi:vancomycin resistance protein YoaR